MSGKPTYEELEQRIEELEKKSIEYESTREMFSLEHLQLLSIFNSIDEPIYISDPDTYELLFVNEAFKKSLGGGVGQKCYKVIQGMTSPCSFCTNDRLFGKNPRAVYIWEFQNRATGRFFHCIDRAIHWPDGRMVRYEMAIDITVHKQAEKDLQKKDKVLQKRAQQIKETNMALKILLKQLKEEKKQIEENIMVNTEKLIFPYIEKMEKERMGERNKTYLGIIKSNLVHLVSPFTKNLSSRYLSLTPKEIEIANLVRHGKTNKEIAGLLNVSTRAIEFHRNNIRKKLGLRNRKTNLRSYLFSLK
jgi:DNA-binding CsgD family transcriptional regulator